MDDVYQNRDIYAGFEENQLFCECFAVGKKDLKDWLMENPRASWGELVTTWNIGQGCGSCLKECVSDIEYLKNILSRDFI